MTPYISNLSMSLFDEKEHLIEQFQYGTPLSSSPWFNKVNVIAEVELKCFRK